ncbi:MAG: diacylglycerol kinase family lipid kinase [Candidatus Cohnella colombiensis]|uniref:Diacylglycerol kinase family lipid kinase n=1 Tax=Candidatus Cohnella colombiensis TaxID=3121368 RepID=A0AA95JAU6_9BACL|nr:MAG: diacylglycerol kinase family lipid kinase [Cohnella sp.]
MILFVVNEASGNGHGRKVWNKVESILKQREISFDKISSESATDAIERTKAFLKHSNVNTIGIVGGDGTIHSLLPLLVGSGISLGLIPTGSGNDTARAFHIPHDPIKALEILLTGHALPSDVLLTSQLDRGDELTLTAVAIGLDAMVAADVNESNYKRWCNRLRIGSFAYIIGLIRALFRFKPSSVTITLDGVTHQYNRGWLTAISNVPSYGGGLKICPQARPDDGQLHVCIVHSCSLWQIIRLFPTLLTGTHVKQPYVKMLSGQQVNITTSAPFLACGDGELIGRTPIEARLLVDQLLIVTKLSG